ncbi:hypothetical protein FACS189459_5920 [Bacilli bacterium]|nr:hypothetical protein FACS189459_5920 [Bacilli bacterium]
MFGVLICNDINFKNMISAINELINEHKELNFIGINHTNSKLQYIVICQTNSIVKANETIKIINDIFGGTGGGNNISAQGGVNNGLDSNKIDELLNKI